ncbi:MAG: hypothetical protein ACFBSE_08975 [Prochloraceae cyanobacterium]
MIKIEPIQPHQVTAVKQIIIKTCQEIFQFSEEVIKGYDTFLDLDRIETNYFGDRGSFLVIKDRDIIFVN